MTTAAQFIIEANDGKQFTVPREVLNKSELIKNMIADLEGNEDQPIKFENIDSFTLDLVVKYCTHYKDHIRDEWEDYRVRHRDMRTDWDKELVKDLTELQLQELILAANFLNIQGLLEVACKTVAMSLTGKTAQEIKDYFGDTRP